MFLDVVHKQEVHNVSHCRQRRAEPRPQITYTENFVKFGLWCLRYASGQTKGHTDTLITILLIHTGGKVKMFVLFDVRKLASLGYRSALTAFSHFDTIDIIV